MPSKSSLEPLANDICCESVESTSIDGNLLGTCTSGQGEGTVPDEVIMLDGEFSSQVDSVKQLLVKRSENYSIPQLEGLYTRIVKAVFEIEDKGMKDGPNTSLLKYLLKYVGDEANF